MRFGALAKDAAWQSPSLERAGSVSTTTILKDGQSAKSRSGAWYQILQTLGDGRNATTHLVVATSGGYAGVPFALKVFKRVNSSISAQRFLDEAAFLKTCGHPAIIRVIDDGVFRDIHPFIVEEYLPLTLRDTMRQGATMVERLSFILQLLSTLAYLASRCPTIAHCDINPENILVKGRSCVLADFGLMQVCDGRSRQQRDAIPIPNGYRTPELVAYANGSSPMSAASDVYQLGLVAAELFSGVNPQSRLNDDDDRLSPIAISPISLIPGANGGLIASLIRRMLEPETSKRLGAAQFIDRWRTPFTNVAYLAKSLEGRVF